VIKIAKDDNRVFKERRRYTAMIKTNIKGVDLVFETSAGVFSPKGIDLGRDLVYVGLLWIFQETDKVLDLGCGYGVVGMFGLLNHLVITMLSMIDIDEEAIRIVKKRIVWLNNVQGVKIRKSDGFTDLEETILLMILSNPPPISYATSL